MLSTAPIRRAPGGDTVKFIGIALLLITLPVAAVERPGPTGALRDCASLKREIAAKIERNGVSMYSLQVVRADQPVAGQIVGHCDGGSARIAYRAIALPAATVADGPRAAASTPEPRQ